MASACISSCVSDTDTRVPIRATYINLYKWPESDAAFVRSVSSNGRQDKDNNKNKGWEWEYPAPAARVVDSISCRQLYLRSYTFSRKESMNEKTKKCIGRVKERVSHRRSSKTRKPPLRSSSSAVVATRLKDASCNPFASIFRRLLSCTTQIDVVG